MPSSMDSVRPVVFGCILSSLVPQNGRPLAGRRPCGGGRATISSSVCELAGNPAEAVSSVPSWTENAVLLLEGKMEIRGGYGQFCPVAMAAEVLCTRWTPLLIRELIAGSTRFNDLRRGVPRDR